MGMGRRKIGYSRADMSFKGVLEAGRWRSGAERGWKAMRDGSIGIAMEREGYEPAGLVFCGVG